MNILKRGSRLRLNLLLRGTVEMFAAIGMAMAGLSVKSSPMILLICFGIAIYLGHRSIKKFQLRAKYEGQAKAESVLLSLMPDLEEAGFKAVRPRRLPSGCRDYLVLVNRTDEIAFVIGLSGMWPGRASLEGPQAIATELTSYGTPHVPVVLAAFMEGNLDQEVFGVIAVTPGRLVTAIEEVVDAFHVSRLEGMKAPPVPYSLIQHRQTEEEYEIKEVSQW